MLLMKPVGLETLLERTPGVAGGQPCLAGTGMPVIQIAAHYRKGESASRILKRFPHLSLALIHAAIAYYLANQAAMDLELQREEAQFQREKASAASRRSA